MGRTVARVGMDLTSAADVRVGGVSLRERRDVGEEEEIEALLLHGNNIASMLDLPSLPSLRKLDLSSNRLTKIECMEGLRALEELDLAANAIESTQGLGFLRRLQKLSLAHNRLSSLRDMAELHGADVALEEIDLRGNRLEDVDELAWLRGASDERSGEERKKQLRYVTVIEIFYFFWSLSPFLSNDFFNQCRLYSSAPLQIYTLLFLSCEQSDAWTTFFLFFVSFSPSLLPSPFPTLLPSSSHLLHSQPTKRKAFRGSDMYGLREIHSQRHRVTCRPALLCSLPWRQWMALIAEASLRQARQSL